MFGDGDTAYFSVNYTLTSLDKDCIGISSIYAKALGIKENDTVILVEVHKPPSIKSMSITPSCESDYEVLVCGFMLYNYPALIFGILGATG